MGCNTSLYISNRWYVADLLKVLKNRLCVQDIKVTGKANISPEFSVIEFTCDGDRRWLSVHLNSDTPIGKATLMSLSMDKQAQDILRSIAMVLGGLYEENDSEDKLEMIIGMLDDGDNLSYHLKQSVLLGYGNGDSISSLKSTIIEFQNTIRTAKNYR